MKTRTAHALVSLYPRAWRREYGAEFADLLSITPLTASVVADVAGHALLARCRALGRTALRPPAMCWRIVGYIRSDDDVSAVYGDDPNGRRDPNNVSGSIAANISGGFGT